MTTLIVTRSDDNECIDRVITAIETQGGRAFRFDTDRFPTDVQIIVGYEQDTEQLGMFSDGRYLDLKDVDSVWYRRMHIGHGIPSTMDPKLRYASRLESRNTVLGLIADLDVFQIDTFAKVSGAENKQLQLRIARNLGLDIPRTLITNDPAAVRAFAADCPQGLITKMLSSFAIYEDGKAQVVFTNPVEPTHLDDLNGLRYCPMTFQERIPKSLELRITIVGDQVFSASIDSQSSAKARHDWRKDGSALMGAWQPHQLPPTVEQRLLKFMDAFGLNYGAVDMIITPDGRYIFLEINPGGEFVWLERSLGLPISSALADVLLGNAKRR